ncbi:C4-dicarboxylate TRAP transporter large permease protein DctM [subsurface metagenome]
MIVGLVPFNQLNSFVLTAIPIFIFMSEVILHSGISDRLYTSVGRLFSHVPGGLMHSNVASSALFAAVTGSSMAAMACIGSIAVPEMKKRGYNMRMALGSTVTAATLGMMIPPSIPMIVYGAMTGTSVGKLFIGGVVPGIMISLLFMSYIGVSAIISKERVGPREFVPWKEGLRGLWTLWPILILMFLVLGTIYLGVCTPTEAAGIGANGALLIAICLRKINWKILERALAETVKISSMILFVFAGAVIFSLCLTNLGIPRALVLMIKEAGLSPILVLLLISLMYLILGCFLDGVSMMLATLPITFPIIIAIGVDPVWFGVIMVLYLEMACVTPPVGINLFVLQGVSGYPIDEIVRGAIPFFLLLIVALVIFILFPDIVLFLPSLV